MRQTHWKPDGRLEARIYQFAAQRPWAERIDDLSLTPEQKAEEIADLFFENRTFVAEVKALSTDTSPKITPILKPHEESEHWPLFYGTRELSDILPSLPNAEDIRRELYEAVSSAIPTLVRKGNRQIRTTKRTFDLPEARGVLIVLNDLVGILTPEIIAHRVAATLVKRHPDKSLQFPEIDAVWIISEQHTVQVTSSLKGFPAVVVMHPAKPEDALTAEFLRRMQGFWAAFNGLPLVRMQQHDTVRTLKYDAAPSDATEEPPIRMQDHWVAEYHARPYLRSLSDEELRTYGAKLGAETGNMFLKGSRSRHHERRRGVRRFAEFMEEFNYRKMDLRSLAPYNDAARIFLPARVRNDPGQHDVSSGEVSERISENPDT